MTRIPIGQGNGGASYIASQFANRHGLIAGATGTGKSVTVAKLAQGFADAGAAVFIADVKGDLAPLTAALDGQVLLDPMRNARLTVKALGPDLLARALNLSEAQAGVTDIAFAYASDTRTPINTLGDFRDVLRKLASNPKGLGARYGLISPASVGAVQRTLLGIEREGCAGALIGPCFDVAKLMTPGFVHVLDATRLIRSPALYGAYLLFVLCDLYDRLPEVGDLDKPRLVLFFDEAHLLFADAPPPLIQRIERIIRLIRSKGVGVYFATQSPADIPAAILAQLGNRVQHALRGATVQDQRAARVAAETMPINPKLDAAGLIMTMGVGQALVSTIGEDGSPRPCDLVRVTMPPLPVLFPGVEIKFTGVGISPAPVETPGNGAGVFALFGLLIVAGFGGALAIAASGHAKPILICLGLLFAFTLHRMAKGR
jgi:hypothetical protein